MPAREDALAAALVTALNAAEFSAEFTAARAHLVKFDTKQIAVLKVSVAPLTKERVRVARKIWRETITLGVCLQKKLTAAETDAQFDALTLLAEEIEDWIAELPGLSGRDVGDISRPAIADPDKMAGREFVAVIAAEFVRDL